MSQYAHLSEPDADTAPTIAKLKQAPSELVTDIHAARRALEESCAISNRLRERNLPSGKPECPQALMIACDNSAL